jgi:hypothetical protein
MGDRRKQMTIVGPDFLARLESGRGVNGVAGSQGNVGGGERISMAVLRNSDSVTGIRFVPLNHPNAPRAFGSASACFTPMSSLLTSFCRAISSHHFYFHTHFMMFRSFCFQKI